MRWPRFALTGLLVGALVGCGANSSTASGSARAGTPANIDLPAHLLAVSELPSGFTLDTKSSGDDSNGDFCGGGLDLAKKVVPAHKAEVLFKKGGEGLFSGTQIDEELMQFDTADQAKRVMTVGRQLLDSCKTFKSTDPNGGSASGSLARLSVPQLGDDALGFALRATATSDQMKGLSLNVAADFVLVRQRQLVLFLANVSIGGDPDAGVTQSVAKLAATKMVSAKVQVPGVESPDETTTTTTTQPAPQPVGATQATSKGKVTVKGVQNNVVPDDEFSRPGANARLFAIDVEACATSDKLDISPGEFELQLDDNTRAERSIASHKPELHSTTVAPGDCLRGFVTYDVPNGRTPTMVMSEDFSGTILRWKLR
jgi:hypothetical protein